MSADGTNTLTWGSDRVAALLRALDIEFIALTPGASFRGLHDSLVNYLGNTRPELLLCLHEEHAVALAHGYAKASGRTMAVALHSNVGLMHATMAIFNAWCDRVPILMLGAQGPMDAVQRRPWIDWIHTARDLGALIRGYTKWDDQPNSVPATMESILRAHQIALTPPFGPVFVCLDAALQEQAMRAPEELPPIERFRPPAPPDPSDDAVARAAGALEKAKRPVILIGRVSSDPVDWDNRVRLAETLEAPVVTDQKQAACFPTAHRLHPNPPGFYAGPKSLALIRAADAILSLDWVDLAGTLRTACAGSWPAATVIHCSMDQFVHNGWSMDHLALPAAEIAILAPPDRLVRKLLAALPAGRAPRAAAVGPAAPISPPPQEPPPKGVMSIEALARTVTEALAERNPSYLRLPIGWAGEYCRFAHPLDYIGYDGGGGIGSGPGMAVGAALALRGSGRLPVSVTGDGDYMMGLTALWTAVHHRIPVLIVVANNQSFFNDELHQERVARQRGRPVENRSIGLRMDQPELDLAALARGQGAEGFGPVRDAAALRATLAQAAERVRAGAVCVVDVRVAPEYARATSSALLRQIPVEEAR